MFIALMLLFAPALSAAHGARSAAAGHGATMSVVGHGATMPVFGHAPTMAISGPCHMPAPNPADQGKAAGKNCCVSMCTAVALAPCAPYDAERLGQTRTAVAGPSRPSPGYLAEIATPPPRQS
ncbi:MAG: hypothetical protein ABIW33_04090 [Sphingomicrobium sp.]